MVNEALGITELIEGDVRGKAESTHQSLLKQANGMAM